MIWYSEVDWEDMKEGKVALDRMSEMERQVMSEMVCGEERDLKETRNKAK